ncbi:hypothetical protein Q5P01_005300 [Channa striata]|uniref:Uncharacterized protein n=1 Tax=Channa striata TaxID=64152 RepID=A0AA88NIB2_CHASR|nr:hypothetical protein Q5P01_005300 [Channa striata]
MCFSCRITMWPKVLIFLTGIVYIPYMLMVESNVTLDSQTIMAILSATSDLQVADSQGVTHTVTLLQSELVAECVIVGDVTTCNCSAGYTWSNDVCYNFSCCATTSCVANVSNMTPLCIPKVNVQIYGSVILTSGMWDATKTLQLQNALQGLNGFQYLNITGLREVNSIADFEAGVMVKFSTSRLQGIVSSLETNLPAVLWVNTLGMVTIMAPNDTVCYQSSPEFICMFEEATDSAGWNMTTNQRYELNSGSVVQLDKSCATPTYQSCLYECGFTSGSVRHTARANLTVALLPDMITMVTNPLTGDCSNMQPTDSVSVSVTAIIPQSTDSYEVWWSYNGLRQSNLDNMSSVDSLVYIFTAALSCQETLGLQYVNITFKNMMGQERSARVDIPVLYNGKSFCNDDVIGGDLWPKTPAGATVINRSCSDTTKGYKSGTCVGPDWQPIFLYCIDQQLYNILNQASDFLEGLGATQEMAMVIFQGLENSSASSSSNNIADISASINVLNTMASASNNVALQDNILPSLINAASNLLNKTWETVNNSVLYNMSSTYLESVENLVKNIKVNNSSGVNSTNLELKFCSSGDCNMSVFDVGVNLNKTNGTLKTLAVKNLTDKLKNIYSTMDPTSLLVSATLDCNNDSSLNIKLEFPTSSCPTLNLSASSGTPQRGTGLILDALSIQVTQTTLCASATT